LSENFRFQWCRIDEFSPRQLHAVLATREAVFIVEQRCAYQDADDLDVHAWHLTAWSQEQVAAYLRVVDPGFKYDEPSIGRVLTSEIARGSGLGKQLMHTAIEKTAEVFPHQAIRISAQSYLLEFYKSFGFQPVSAEYLEDDIPHVEMLRTFPR
jgi:ElaA protein